ncbi:FxsA family protein [Pseudorhodobacter turbinis]|uniref:FxsA family protein n=1 Tax=Pseudorhodobacter turbinis TaxID=2500533 RepID=A0A4P8EGB4_9RHOB|nr:FxsA family protein [Pseudorhodobacter turbinis]QCO55762.1 FxsA family protein [Pseudorhodobacter turbinis]
MWLLLAFVVVPLIEIGLFIQVGGWLTLWPTLAIVLATGIIGTVLVRRQGLRVLAELRSSMSQMRDPLSPLAHGAMILFAGALLLTPGFFTDTVGFLLLIPQLRQMIITAIAARVTVVGAGATTAHRPPGNDIIDAEYIDVSDDNEPNDPKNNRPSRWTEH